MVTRDSKQPWQPLPPQPSPTISSHPVASLLSSLRSLFVLSCVWIHTRQVHGKPVTNVVVRIGTQLNGL